MKAFLSYSHNDSWALDRLHAHLAVLRRQNQIAEWFDRDVLAGAEIDAAIQKQLVDAEIFLPLVSPDFLASNYCYEREMAHAIARHDEGTIRIVPIIIEPCDWKSSPLQRFKALPRDGKPITEWTNQNNAFLDIVTELRRIVSEGAAMPPGQLQESPPAEVKPRKYRLKRDFDEIDRAEFRQQAFADVQDYFQKAVEEIVGIEGIKARMSVLSPQSFSCTVLNTAKQRGAGHITVHASADRRGFGDLYYSNQENAESGTANGTFRIEADEYELFLSGDAFHSTGRDEKLSSRQVAERLWGQLLERTGISDA